MKRILESLRRLMPYLPSSARRYLIWYCVLTAILAVVDVIALMLLALVLAAAATGNTVALPVVGALPSDVVPWMILVLSILVVGKSAANVGLQWGATRRFATYDLAIGERLFSAYIRAPWTERLGKNTAQIVQMADTGIANVVAGFLLPITTLPGLVVTSVGVAGVIVFAQPLTALITVVYLGGIALLQYAVLGKKTRQAARVARDSTLRVAALVSGMVASLKEITLRAKADEVEAVVRGQRALTAGARANVSFLSSVPRFVFDSAIIGGFLLTGGVGFVSQGMEGAIAAIALFGIAGFRLVPALTGFQSVVTRTTTAMPYVDAVIADIDASEVHLREQERLGQEPLPSAPRRLTLDAVGFTYPSSSEPAIADLNLTIPIGTTVGIAGSSGAGKSTLVDLLLGLITPTAGRIELDGKPLEDVLAAWRRHVGYVPQDVTLFDGTIAQNIALTWGKDVDLERAEHAARRAQLWDVIQHRDKGLQSPVGERGLTLSGGQRQRLGIARALYSEPLVLVLDEATSALDTKTEADVSEAIRGLHGDVTVIAVAHRLSTIRRFDQIVFMKDGGVAASGTFEEVVAESREFALQAQLAGLT